jgi:hypothetical protein
MKHSQSRKISINSQVSQVVAKAKVAGAPQVSKPVLIDFANKLKNTVEHAVETEPDENKKIKKRDALKTIITLLFNNDSDKSIIVNEAVNNDMPINNGDISSSSSNDQLALTRLIFDGLNYLIFPHETID